MSHVRTTPKRTVGVGKIQALNGSTIQEATVSAIDDNNDDKTNRNGDSEDEEEVEIVHPNQIESINMFFQQAPRAPEMDSFIPQSSDKPKTWAMLVNPTAFTATAALHAEFTDFSHDFIQANFAKINMEDGKSDQCMEGQFSDAEDEEDITAMQYAHDDKSDEFEYDEDADISDEECDVYILDPDEIQERNRSRYRVDDRDEIQNTFPSLAASLKVPYDEVSIEDTTEFATPAILAKHIAEQKKLEALKPVSKSGKMYNSFQKYSEIMKPKIAVVESITNNLIVEKSTSEASKETKDRSAEQSRIIGGADLAGQGNQVEDDGEGWIKSTKEIRQMKAAGKLNPTQIPPSNSKDTVSHVGPHNSKRSACTTTDFAMQNVILQMNLELLTVDGIKVRRLKTWVSRCGACFTIYTDTENSGPYKHKRLFCSRCGSDMMQRVAASVDSKTGRLRLHLSKKYKTSTRGTKFSLPKPGSNNRFQGDLLLREDQLMVGAWNQKVKKISGRSSLGAAQSIFGSDLAANMGCHAAKVHLDDIKVGFGRRNPNAATGGRERRGKKKKTGDKACGLRRY